MWKAQAHFLGKSHFKYTHKRSRKMQSESNIVVNIHFRMFILRLSYYSGKFIKETPNKSFY